MSLGSEGRIRRLQASHRFHLQLLDELDHASWVKRQRERLIEVVEAYLAAAYGTVGNGPAHTPDLRVGSDRTQ